MASVDREARAREAKHLFEWYVSWKPPRWPEFPLEGRKDILIRDSGKYVAAKLLSTGLVTPKEDEERLRNTIGYCQSVFDISEIGEGGHNVGERLSSNIYDVLFAKRRLLGEWEHGDELYRGQFSSEWRLVASYFRNLQLDSNLLEPETQKAELKAMMQYWLSGGRHGGTTKSLLDETERNEKLNELSIRFPDVDFARLTPLEQEAVIQHYMSGTALVDFTTSIEVAAFFLRQAAIKTIKRGSPQRLQWVLFFVWPGERWKRNLS
jgi:FRG domain